MLQDRLCLALDGLEAPEAVMLARTVRNQVGYVKVGLELFIKAGRGIVASLSEGGPKIFLDLKLHDIPATVVKAIQALPREAQLTTIHAAGGKAMMQAAVDVGVRPKLLAVTCLTSMDEAELANIQVRLSPGLYVAAMLPLIRSCKVDGVVCSAEEVGFVKGSWSECFCVVPGIRLPDGDHHDQKRVGTPAQAMRDGADMLVVGRAITQAADPVSAARTILADMEVGLSTPV